MEDNLEPVSVEELKKIGKKKRLVFFVGMMAPRRPGVQLFAVMLEYVYFPPMTEKNKEIVVSIAFWEGALWQIVGIPKKYFGAAKSIAGQIGLEISRTIPHSVSPDGETAFPLKGKNVFTLLNVKNHVLYGNDPWNIEELLAKEDELIQRIIIERKKQIAFGMAYS